MSYPTDEELLKAVTQGPPARGRESAKSAHPVTLTAIDCEVMKARYKFPGNRFLLAALMEEVGELAQAMLQKRPRDEIERECIQVACVAVRILEEGDDSFKDIQDHEAKP